MAKVRREWGSITKRGERYYVRYSDGAGKRRWKVAGDRRADALDLLARLRDQVELERRGVHVTPMTLADWWDEEYLGVLVSRLKPAGVVTAQTGIQRFVDFMPEVFIGDVVRADAEAFVSAMTAEGLQPSYIRRCVGTLKRAWSDAMTRGLAHINPWSKLKIAAPRPTQVPWITPQDLTAIYAAAPDSARPHLTVIGDSGLRVGEAQKLQRRDVDLENPGGPRVVVRDGKTLAARRTVPLTPRAAAALRPHLERCRSEKDLVLPVCGQNWLRRALKTACKRVGCEPLVVHGLRHVYASHLVQGGVPPSTVARLLGHADGGALVMKLYGRWMPHDAESRAVAVLTELRGARAPAPPPPPDPRPSA